MNVYAQMQRTPNVLPGGATPWARALNFVKKPPLIVNATYLELNGFNASMWVS